MPEILPPQPPVPPQPPEIEKKQPKEKKGTLQKEIEKINRILFLMITVLLVGFITMLVGFLTLIWNAHLFGQSTYQEIVNDLKEQGDKIDILLREVPTSSDNKLEK